MLRQALIYTALVLAVGTAATKCDTTNLKGGGAGDTKGPLPALTADPGKAPYCTPANSTFDSFSGVCQDPPAPPQDQPQPTWALRQQGWVDSNTAFVVICAPLSGPGVVSEYWPHTPADYQHAVKACDG
jgi:hypothetical protein